MLTRAGRCGRAWAACALEFMTPTGGCRDAMIALSEAKRTISEVVDPARAYRSGRPPTHELDRARIKLYFPDTAKPVGKLHHKLMVIDEATVWRDRSITLLPRTSTTMRTSSSWAARTRDLPKRKGGPVDQQAPSCLASSERRSTGFNSRERASSRGRPEREISVRPGRVQDPRPTDSGAGRSGLVGE